MIKIIPLADWGPRSPASLSEGFRPWDSGCVFSCWLLFLSLTNLGAILRLAEQAEFRCSQGSHCCLCQTNPFLRPDGHKPSLPCLIKHLFFWIPYPGVRGHHRSGLLYYLFNCHQNLIPQYPLEGVHPLKSLAVHSHLMFLGYQGHWESTRTDNYHLARPLTDHDRSLSRHNILTKNGVTTSTPKDSPLGCIANWSKFRQDGLRKEKLIFFRNTAWPQYKLGDQEIWPENGSLNYNTILQLDLFCKREGKWG